MTSRLPSLYNEVTAFSLLSSPPETAPDLAETVDAWLAVGVTGIEATVRTTADNVAVVSSGQSVGSRLRRRRIADLAATDLPDGIPTLADLLRTTGGSVALALNIDDDVAFDAVMTTVGEWGNEAEDRLWLIHPDPDQLSRWRPRTRARLVNSARLNRLDEGTERRLSRLHSLDLDGLRMFHTDWTGGTVALAHRFEMLAVGWGAEHERELAALVDAGIDAVSSERVEPMVAVIAQYYG